MSCENSFIHEWIIQREAYFPKLIDPLKNKTTRSFAFSFVLLQKPVASVIGFKEKFPKKKTNLLPKKSLWSKKRREREEAESTKEALTWASDKAIYKVNKCPRDKFSEKRGKKKNESRKRVCIRSERKKTNF